MGRIILDGVKDHIVTHIVELDTMKKMWDAIFNLYENATTNRKMTLRDKLKNTQMNKEEDVTSYLSRLKLFKDELVVVGNSSSDNDLVRITLNVFTKFGSLYSS